MSRERVRVRFAPSPTGGLHIGGVRTALFNYLFAKKNQGDFLIRIEDTDQSRFVPGAESYIFDALKWVGLEPDESPVHGGPHAPYRQSERKELYRQYADQLIASGNAYFAFDTPEELDQMRKEMEAAGLANQTYNAASRMRMRNSLTLSDSEVKSFIEQGVPYVIRLKVPEKEEIRLQDIIRGWVVVHSSTIDDKVLIKSDGLPTYHLANVVDDYLMEISHVIRGEEWLPSAPLHVLLYRFLGWENVMPKFAHLPLILKPDGNGKLSKRAADQAGFPIFPLNWEDPESGLITKGFKEAGFLPEALINFLALLGWNPGTDQEIFDIPQLISTFSLERINKAGTRFDIEKARWFNQQYILNMDAVQIGEYLHQELLKKGRLLTDEQAVLIAKLLQPRITYLHEMIEESTVFFDAPVAYDAQIINKKWNEEAQKGLEIVAEAFASIADLSADQIKELVHQKLESAGINPGKVMQILRVAISGKGSGPDLMPMISLIGTKSSAERIKTAIETFNSLKTTH